MSGRNYWKPKFERFQDPAAKPSPELEAVVELLKEEGVLAYLERSSIHGIDFGICCTTIMTDRTFHLTLEDGNIVVRNWPLQTRRNFPLADPESIEKAADFMRHL